MACVDYFSQRPLREMEMVKGWLVGLAQKVQVSGSQGRAGEWETLVLSVMEVVSLVRDGGEKVRVRQPERFGRLEGARFWSRQPTTDRGMDDREEKEGNREVEGAREGKEERCARACYLGPILPCWPALGCCRPHGVIFVIYYRSPTTRSHYHQEDSTATAPHSQSLRFTSYHR